MLYLILVKNVYHVKKWESLHNSTICPLTRELEELHIYNSFPKKKKKSVFLQPGIYIMHYK